MAFFFNWSEQYQLAKTAFLRKDKNPYFSYTDNGLCEIAYLDFLEDPSDNNPKTFYIDVDEVPLLNMNCRGGYGCCNKEHANMCVEGDGDCEEDEDCTGHLICGNNNCNKWRSLTGSVVFM